MKWCEAIMETDCRPFLFHCPSRLHWTDCTGKQQCSGQCLVPRNRHSFPFSSSNHHWQNQLQSTALLVVVWGGVREFLHSTPFNQDMFLGLLWYILIITCFKQLSLNIICTKICTWACSLLYFNLKSLRCKEKKYHHVKQFNMSIAQIWSFNYCTLGDMIAQ